MQIYANLGRVETHPVASFVHHDPRTARKKKTERKMTGKKNGEITSVSTCFLGLFSSRHSRVSGHKTRTPECSDLAKLITAYLKRERITGIKSQRERNVLFNDALNTFYLWLYGVRHVVKDHSDSENGLYHGATSRS